MRDFEKEKPSRPASLVVEKDPPDDDRTRSVLNKGLSPAVMKTLRERFARAAEAKADELIEIGEFDAIVELAQGFPLSVFPDAVGMRKGGREHLLPYAGAVFNAFGPDNDLRRNAIERAAPHISWIAEQCQRQNLALDGLGAKIFAPADAAAIAMKEAPDLLRPLPTAVLTPTLN